MKHLIYKTTNLINGKFYYGAHSTLNIHDAYLGSGTLIKNAIKKYGRNNFVKEIVGLFDSREDMFEFEELLITVVKDNKHCYNISNGGMGGNKGTKHTLEWIETARIRNMGEGNAFYGKSHSNTTKNQISKSKKGINNYKHGQKTTSGYVWVNDGVNHYRVPKEESIQYPYRGRLGRTNQYNQI